MATMKKFMVVKPMLRMNGGTIGLTTQQAQRRSNRLKALKKGVYEVTGAIEFKKGEVIGFDDATLSKAARASLVVVDASTGKAAGKTAAGASTGSTSTGSVTGNEAAPDAIAGPESNSPIAE